METRWKVTSSGLFYRYITVQHTKYIKVMFIQLNDICILGDIQLLEVENKNIVYTMKVGSKVSSVDWLQDKNKFIIPSDKVDKDLKEGQNDMVR